MADELLLGRSGWWWCGGEGDGIAAQFAGVAGERQQEIKTLDTLQWRYLLCGRVCRALLRNLLNSCWIGGDHGKDVPIMVGINVC